MIKFSPQHDIGTKIVWSFAHDTIDAKLADLVAGERFDALRLVYFPNADSKITEFLQALQKQKNGHKIPVMLDIALKIRATVANKTQVRSLSLQDKVSLVPTATGASNEIVVNTDEWMSLFSQGAMIYVGSNVALRCLEVHSQHVSAEVVQGEAIDPQAVIRVPSTYKKTVAADLMLAEIEEFLAHGLDFVVVPGMTELEEVKVFRAFLLKKTTTAPWLILKADTMNAYQALPALIDAVDGVLISRRELALTTAPATVPMLTKEVIKLCAEHAKLALTASELLGSMRYNPSPTRAEVSDIANAVIDGTDVLVLPEELSLGKFFLRSLQLVYEIIADVEESMVEPNWHQQEPTIKTEYDALTTTAYRTAHRLDVRAFVCLTNSGETAVRLSRYRTSIPIIALVFAPHLLNRLCLAKGVRTMHLRTSPSLDEVLPMVSKRLKSDGYLATGDQFIFFTITLSPLGRVASNLFTVQQIE